MNTKMIQSNPDASGQEPVHISIIGSAISGIQSSASTQATALEQIEVGAGEHATYLTIVLGSADLNCTATLAAAGSKYTHHVLYVATGKDEVNINIVAVHAAADTQAEMIVHGIATGKSRVHVTGNILIEPGAQKTDAHLQHEGLLLSRGARISALPGFEIHTDDVKAQHSSAVHFVRPEQLFYLQTRGISTEDGRALIVDGFIEALLNLAVEPEKVVELVEQIQKTIGTISFS